MRLGIFGGSFNPPHNIHLKIAEYLIKQNYVDKVIYVPTGSKYQYKNNLIAPKHRLNMLKLLINNNHNLSISTYELQSRPIYTYETLTHFKNKYPNDTIYFICGMDNLDYLDKWYKGLEILKNFKLLVIKRNHQMYPNLFEKYHKYLNNITLVEFPEESISSTMIRNNILNNKDNTKYLKSSIIEYITKNNLYKKEE